MVWLWVVVAVVLIGIATVVAVGSGDSLAEVYDDRPDRTIPVGRPLTADDLTDVRFTTAVRGYRMDEVDALVARVRADLISRQADAAVAGTEPDEVDGGGATAVSAVDSRTAAELGADDAGGSTEVEGSDAGLPERSP